MTVHITIIAHWSITIARRIMHRTAKNYLLMFSVFSIIWFALRNIKWRAFENLEAASRFTWYLFYIPLIIVPLLGFYITLHMDKSETFKLNKKWNLLFIPATLLIIFIATNDVHQSVFSFDTNFSDWNNSYNYEWGYWVVLTFIIAEIFATLAVLLKKWRKTNKFKNSYFTISVICAGVLYMLIYIIDRPTADILLDMTTFTVLFYALFWESCIHAGMISSNTNHNAFFIKSKLSAQIVDNNGKVRLISDNTASIFHEQFDRLRTNGSFEEDENSMLNIASINCGYVIWNSDISKISAIKKELFDINLKLRDEVSLLEREKLLREQNARIKKLHEIHNKINKQTSQSMEKIKELAQSVSFQSESDVDSVLREINLISCYMKRKTHLLLMLEDNKTITNGDMIICYKEVFRGLELTGAVCSINYYSHSNISSNMHILCYDLFEQLLEMSRFELQAVLINCTENDQRMRFSITVSKNSDAENIDFSNFNSSHLENIGGLIKTYDDRDSFVVVLSAPSEVA